MLRLNSLNLREREPLEPGLNYLSSSPIDTLRINILKPFGPKTRVSFQEGLHLVSS